MKLSNQHLFTINCVQSISEKDQNGRRIRSSLILPLDMQETSQNLRFFDEKGSNMILMLDLLKNFGIPRDFNGKFRFWSLRSKISCILSCFSRLEISNIWVSGFLRFLFRLPSNIPVKNTSKLFPHTSDSSKLQTKRLRNSFFWK